MKVVDASALVALLTDAGPAGAWVVDAIGRGPLVAPHLVLFETANVLRRHAAAELISSDQAALAHRDLLDLDLGLWPYELLAARVWELRRNATAYDASYLALAEQVGAPLITFDGRLRNVPGARAEVLVGPLDQS
ncbi:PIN domain-containing protein [Sporichthya brevicatena]|uniref:Ribonuclease VapC n=1 Tax=Sporichthya brevicatena TaxID=171442 RepID=A0ABP3SD42_9ACTN